MSNDRWIKKARRIDEILSRSARAEAAISDPLGMDYRFLEDLERDLEEALELTKRLNMEVGI